MRMLRADLREIAPEHAQEWLVRDGSGYRLNRENPYVRALIAEVQACLDGGMAWADFVEGHPGVLSRDTAPEGEAIDPAGLR